MASVAGTTVCAECGSAVTGRFCSNCGAELAQQRYGLIRQVIANIGQFPATFLRMLVAPVKTTIALSQDPAYRAHFSFMAVSVTLSVLITAYAAAYLPEQLTAQLATNPELANSPRLKWWLDLYTAHQKELFSVIIYTYVVLLLIANFIVLKRFRPKNSVTLGKYFKLFCLASGFYLAISALSQAVSIFALGYDPGALQKAMGVVGALEAMKDFYLSPAGLLSLAVILALLVYHVRVQTHYWGLSTTRVVVSLPLVLIVFILIFMFCEIVIGGAVIAAVIAFNH